MKYGFKRDIYNQLHDNLQSNNIVFLLGPRKCGKTVCMIQTHSDTPSSEMINFKTLNDEQSQDVFNNIKESIKNNEEKTYFLDEITYAWEPERSIYSLADSFTEYQETKTKVVFAGSQSVALESWGKRAFAGSAAYIHADFLSFAEYLRFLNKQPSEDTYKKFLFYTKDFYHFSTVKDYIEGCLEETVLSNYKTANIVFNNDCSDIDSEMLLDVLYAIMLTGANQVNEQTFKNKEVFSNTLKFHFPELSEKENTFAVDKISDILVKRYRSLKGTSAYQIQQSLTFLYKCGLITITPVANKDFGENNIAKKIMNGEYPIKNKNELFQGLNICIKYPMFYSELIREIVGEDTAKTLTNSLLGGIVETHIRGIMPQRGVYEYHDEEDREVDYVDISSHVAIEISISNKSVKHTHFDVLPNDYQPLLLTKDKTSINDNIIRVPYYEFIASNGDVQKYLDMFLEQENAKNIKLE